MDVNEARLKEISQKFGKVKYYLKEKDLLSDPDVQAVYIATPVCLHARQAVMAAEVRKHVFCEKQMAMNIKECLEMITACKKNKVKLGLAYMMRFNVYHRRIKEMIEKGDLGNLVMGRAQLSCWYPEIAGAWRQDPKQGGGGSLIDMGSHGLDILEMFFGRTKEVTCLISNRAHKYPVEDTALVLTRFESGAIGIVDNCFSLPDASSLNTLEVYGTKGSLIAKGTIGQGPGGELVARLEKAIKGYEARQARQESVEEKIEIPSYNTYQAEIEDFSEAVLTDRSPSFSGEDGLWNQKVVMACYESAGKKKTIGV